MEEANYNLNERNEVPHDLLVWLSYLRQKGANNEEIIDELLRKTKYSISFIKELVSMPTFEDWYNLSLKIRNPSYELSRLNTNLAQIYKINNFLSKNECNQTINLIESSDLSQTGSGPMKNSYTDKKCTLEESNEVIKKINLRISQLLGINDRFSKKMLGMKYEENNYKKPHFDNPWVDKSDEITIAKKRLLTKKEGITTWTILIYLNTIPKGGQTYFPKLKKGYKPIAGTLLAWNNLNSDGSINPYSMHEALPITDSKKYILVKWFKSYHYNIN